MLEKTGSNTIPTTLLHAAPCCAVALQVKEDMVEKIGSYIQEKIRAADNLIVEHAIAKIQVCGGGRCVGWGQESFSYLVQAECAACH